MDLAGGQGRRPMGTNVPKREDAARSGPADQHGLSEKIEAL
jgi:hypothetical protein